MIRRQPLLIAIAVLVYLTSAPVMAGSHKLAATEFDSSAQIICADEAVRNKITINEMLRNGGGTSLKFVEVKVKQQNTDISDFELCMGEIGASAFCRSLGTGYGSWEQEPTGKHSDNEGPINPDASGNSTTFYSPTYLNYVTTDFYGVMPNDGQLVLRQISNQSVIDYICYGKETECQKTSLLYAQPTLETPSCWASVITDSNTKLLARVPDGSGDFTVILDPKKFTDGTTNDTPDNCPTCPATPPFSGRAPIVFKWQVFY